ncbi:AraC family transcriptional regulator [Cohnella sp. GCM10012308]|uniref:AraC family transcriptional regulator n=1 Tax=Cohnella sp. GCM10012308 TaxID=3317329 RepID=UPI00362297B3
MIKKGALRRGEVIPPHSHDIVELILVQKGKAFHDFGGMNYEIAAGDMFIIEPNINHGYIGSESAETVIYTLLFDPRVMQYEFGMNHDSDAAIVNGHIPFLRKGEKLPAHLIVPRRAMPLITAHMEFMIREYQAREAGFKLLIKMRMLECFVHLGRFYTRRDWRKETILNDSDSAVIDSVKRYIERHYNESFSLEQISRLHGMSVTSLTTKFKSAVGRTLIDYKHEIQIREASKLLADLDVKIVEVAHKVGFKDLSFFYQVFQKKTGITPAAYQSRQVRGKHV